MDIDEISEMWETDSEFDVDISRETQRTPKLHNKYYRLFMKEMGKLEMLNQKLGTLKKQKREYYDGKMSDEEMRGLGWEPNPLKILKSDLAMYVNDDTEVQSLTFKKSLQKIKVDYIESLVKQIANRGFQIKSIIDWERFKTGA